MSDERVVKGFEVFYFVGTHFPDEPEKEVEFR